MKKHIFISCLITLLVFSTSAVHAQFPWNSVGADIATDPTVNNVGIGAGAILDKLTVNGDIGFEPGNSLRLLKGRSDNGLGLYSGDDWDKGGSIFLSGPAAPFDEGSVTLLSKGINTMNKLSFKLAATDGGVWHTRMYIDQNGSMGIGDLMPIHPGDRLTVQGGITLYEPSATDYRNIKARASASGLALSSDDSWGDGSSILLNGSSNTGNDPGSITFLGNGANTANRLSFKFAAVDGTNWLTRMYIDQNGSMGIGDLMPIHTGDRLTVQGGITLYEPGATDYRNIRARASNSGLALSANDSWGDGSGILLNGNSTGFDQGAITFLSNGVNNLNKLSFKFAAVDGTNWRTRMYIDQIGNMTVGELSATNPGDKLSVMGALSLYESSPTDYRKIRARASQSGLEISANSTWSDGAAILLNGNAQSGNFNPGSIYLVSNPGNNGQGGNICFSTKNNSTGWDTHMIINKEGRVTIGNVSSATPSEYKLFVEKGILTERVRVAIHGSPEWADYVFADDYNLKPLHEVEAFINENNHLPDVPSADEVVKNGVDVGKMDATLLQKIEELTLYLIELKKENDGLTKRINALETK